METVPFLLVAENATHADLDRHQRWWKSAGSSRGRITMSKARAMCEAQKLSIRLTCTVPLISGYRDRCHDISVSYLRSLVSRCEWLYATGKCRADSHEASPYFGVDRLRFTGRAGATNCNPHTPPTDKRNIALQILSRQLQLLYSYTTADSLKIHGF
jgi:hypothetical protein